MSPNHPTKLPIRHRFRKHEIQARLQQDIELNHYPRLVVFILIIISGLSAFIMSFALLKLGIHDLALRYLIVWILVYFLFALGLRIWLALKTSENSGWDNADISNVFPDSFSSSHHTTSNYAGNGGNFGGGGAKGSWSENTDIPLKSSHDVGSVSDGGSLFDGFCDGAGEEVLPLAVIFAVVAFIAAMLGGVLWISYSLIDIAPVFLAELLADFLIMNGLGRRLRLASAEKQHWFLTFWQHTRWFFIIVAGLIMCLFALLHHYHIPAQTIGQLFHSPH